MSTPSRRHARPVAGRPAVQPHPLANLPRPLSERERGRRRVTPMRIGLLVGAIGILAGAALTAGSLGVPALDPVGDVAGAVATVAPSPTPTARVDVAPAASPRPTATPIPTPTPVPTPAPVTSLTGYVSPLPNGRLTLPFGPSPWGSRVVDGELFHDGIDLATFCGDRVVAAHAGTVLAAGRKYDAHMGWVGDLQPYLDRLERKHLWITLPIVVVIDDGNGYRSIYAHFGKVVVKRGDVVEAGELIGYEGQTGRASGCHLHYGLFSPLETATFAIDPDVVKRMKVPALELARVDPLIVLPMHAPKPKPTPSPSIDPKASAGATPGVLPSPSARATAAPTP